MALSDGMGDSSVSEGQHSECVDMDGFLCKFFKFGRFLQTRARN